MGYFYRIEADNLVNFTTTRTQQSRLWFANNTPLEESMLGSLAKGVDRYKAKIYAFAIEGNHKHELIQFPEAQRADFFRDFNSDVARAVKRHCKDFIEGSCWARRYSNEFVPRDEDIEAQFWYIVLQQVQDGLVASIDEWPWYNCFYDAIKGREKEYKVRNWAKFNSDKRRKRNISLDDYTTMYTLKYERLPGYEHLSQKEYEKMMLKKLKEKTREIVKERRRQGKGFVGRTNLLKGKNGAFPRTTKRSGRWDHRPRVLCSCDKTRHEVLRWMFDMIHAYQDASYDYRLEGDVNAKFPPGMYKPPVFTARYSVTHEDLLDAAA
jgi:putative transposase